MVIEQTPDKGKVTMYICGAVAMLSPCFLNYVGNFLVYGVQQTQLLTDDDFGAT